MNASDLISRIKNIEAALKSLPAKVKSEYATDYQLTQYNQNLADAVPLISATTLRALPIPHGIVHRVLKYADVLTSYAQLRSELEVVEDPPPMPVRI